MVDILELVDYAVKKGVLLLTIDNGYQLENKTAMGKMYLGMVSAMAEAERELRAERCQAGIDAAKEELKANGFRVARCSGRMQTHFGNEKGTAKTKAIMAKARDASALSKQNRTIEWREKSSSVLFARRKRAEGWTMQQIVDEIGHMFDDYAKTHPDEPNIYATPTGCKPMRGTISKWLRESNLLLVG